MAIQLLWTDDETAYEKNRHAQVARLKSKSGACLQVCLAQRSPERVLRKCSQCRRRRMVLRQSCLCRSCEPMGRDLSVAFAECSLADRRALHYFQHFATIDLSGYLPGRFWDDLLLRLCTCEPLVRRAVVATATAHQDYSEKAVVSAGALTTHQKALQELHTHLAASPSHEVVLACCILFYTFDKLSNDAESAVVHRGAAMKIVNSIVDGPRDIVDLLLLMDIEATMPHIGSRPHLIDGTFARPMPESFSSPHHSYGYWMPLAHDIFRFVGDNVDHRKEPEPVMKEGQRLLDLAADWRRAADLMKPGSVLDKLRLRMFMTHYLSVRCVLTEALGMDTWDESAEELLETGTEILRLRKLYIDGKSLPSCKTFSAHVGVAECFLILAHRTKQPDVRRRAQEIVKGIDSVQHGLSGMTDFFGAGEASHDFVLMLEPPGH